MRVILSRPPAAIQIDHYIPPGHERDILSNTKVTPGHDREIFYLTPGHDREPGLDDRVKKAQKLQDLIDVTIFTHYEMNFHGLLPVDA